MTGFHDFPMPFLVLDYRYCIFNTGLSIVRIQNVWISFEFPQPHSFRVLHTFAHQVDLRDPSAHLALTNWNRIWAILLELPVVHPTQKLTIHW